jgi:hypothetical protein
MPRWFFWWRPPCLLRRVIVNVTYRPDEAIRGVLWSYRWGWLTLKECEGLTVGQQPAPIDGDVTIHVSKVAYFQVVPA